MDVHAVKRQAGFIELDVLRKNDGACGWIPEAI